MPLFSIITPVYNGEKYISNTINSVLAQDYKDFEYIIVNDGSTDKTEKIINDFQKNDNRIKVINQNNQWIFAAMNNGCSIAKGDYIFFINSDDLMREGTLTAAYNLIKKYNPDVIWTRIHACKCNENQEIIEDDLFNSDEIKWEEKFYANQDELRKNWIWLYEMKYSLNNINFYKRNLTIKYPYRNDFYGADTFFNAHMASSIQTAVTMVKPSITYFIYENNNMNASCGKYYGYEHMMFQTIMKEHKKRLEEWGMFNGYNKEYLYKRALREVSQCTRTMHSPYCKLSAEEKIEKIMTECFDDEMYEIAREIDSVEELESRILSALRNILLKEKISESSKWYFIYQILEILLKYEKNKNDKEELLAAINNPLNHHHLGRTFMDKLGDGAWDF